MARKRPGAATAAGVMSIIYGSLFTLCGICGVGSLFLQGANPNMFAGADPNQAKLQKLLQDAMEREIPAYYAYQVASPIIGLILAVILLFAGIGILNMRNGARITAILTCFATIIVQLVQAFYTLAFMFPAMNKAFGAIGQVDPNVPRQAIQAMQSVMMGVSVAMAVLYFLVMIYLLLIVIFLCRGHVRAAYAGGPSGDWQDRGDDRAEYEPPQGRESGYEDEDDWQRPPPRGDEPDEGHFREQR